MSANCMYACMQFAECSIGHSVYHIADIHVWQISGICPKNVYFIRIIYYIPQVEPVKYIYIARTCQVLASLDFPELAVSLGIRAQGWGYDIPDMP